MRPRYLLAFSGALLLLVLGGIYVRDLGNSSIRRLLVTTETYPKVKNDSAQRRDAVPSSGPGATSAALSKPANAADDHPDVTPVVVASVTQADVPIFLSGIGTVVAYFTVDAKALVDGVILKVNFQEGDDVKIGDPLVTIDPTPYAARVAQWKAAQERAQAQLENAKTNHWRDQQLLAHNFATQKQTDADATLVSQFTADIAEDEAQIAFAQYQLDNTVIRSPINGRTGIRHVDPGNLIRAADNTNIVTVVQTRPISVIITVPAKALVQAGILPGLSDLTVFAYTQDGVTLLDTGKVQTVNNVVDPATGTIKLKANFPNERSRLWPGDFVDCRIVVETRHNGLTVPTAAIQQGPKGSYVWVVRPDGTAEPKAVFVKQTVGDTVLLDRGVQPNEKVVVEGQFYLHSGARVRIVPQLLANDSENSDVAGPTSKD
jgi:multidrug efflux system membrane fusion protein